MGRLRIVLTVVALAGGISLLGLASPECAYACSCVPPRPIAEYANEPDTLILAGTVTAVGQDLRGRFRVERWFMGFSEVAEIPIQGGNGADCGLPIVVGQRLVLVASAADGVLFPSICSPSGDLSTPEGQALQAETIVAFGEGTPPAETAPSNGGLAIPDILVLGAAVIVGLIAVVAGASFLSSRGA